MTPSDLLAVLSDLYESAPPSPLYAGIPDPFAWKLRAQRLLDRYRDEQLAVMRRTRQLPEDFSLRWQSTRYAEFWFELRATWPDDVVVFGDLHEWIKATDWNAR